VFGHTHRAVVVRDPDGRLVVNPGAAGPRRFDVQPCIAILTVEDGRAEVALRTL
jgi:predicted phosphodiesterase